MMHPDTKLEWISEEVGYGVVATKALPKGTITWVQDELDGVFPPEKPAILKAITRDLLEKYSFRNHRGEHILCWDLAKFVNHSFKSNCLSTAYSFEIAIRDIAVGEELTDDYGYLNLTESFIPKDEGTERKTVHPDDILKCYKDWDKKLEAVIPLIFDLEQPLEELLSDKVRREIEEVSEGKKKMLSTKSLYFRPKRARI